MGAGQSIRWSAVSKQSKKSAKRVRRKAAAVIRRAQATARHELAVANSEADEIRERARLDAEAESAELRAEAHRESAQVRSDARTDAREEVPSRCVHVFASILRTRLALRWRRTAGTARATTAAPAKRFVRDTDPERLADQRAPRLNLLRR